MQQASNIPTISVVTATPSPRTGRFGRYHPKSNPNPCHVMASSTHLQKCWHVPSRIASFALLFGSLVVSNRIFAQTAPAASTQSAPAEEVLELSPFEVTASEDKGYVGQNSLAGSRVRTDLKDLAAAISPMTSEFLKDIAATNLEN